MNVSLTLMPRFIEIHPDHVVLGPSRFALLADIEQAVTVAPGEFARIPAPLRFAGNGRAIAVVDMHAGREAHMFDDHDPAIANHGDYILAPPGVETEVVATVINESSATLMIRPGTRIGVLNFINTQGGEAEEAIPAQNTTYPTITLTEQQSKNLIELLKSFPRDVINDYFESQPQREISR